MKRAKLIAEAVSVTCPECGEPQPNKDDSEMWTPEDFKGAQGKRQCVSCDAMMIVSHETKVHFLIPGWRCM